MKLFLNILIKSIKSSKGCLTKANKKSQNVSRDNQGNYLNRIRIRL